MVKGKTYYRTQKYQYVHDPDHPTEVSQTFFGFVTWDKGVARGVLGCPWPPLLKAFFNQTTYNRWRKCHDDTLAIVTIWWVPSLWHSVTPPPLWKILATPLWDLVSSRGLSFRVVRYRFVTWDLVSLFVLTPFCLSHFRRRKVYLAGRSAIDDEHPNGPVSNVWKIVIEKHRLV